MGPFARRGAGAASRSRRQSVRQQPTPASRSHRSRGRAPMTQEFLSADAWNIEWRAAGSAAAAILRERLGTVDPDIVCLTEGYADFFGDDGHVIEAEPDYGYPLVDGRRKVLLWSGNPWMA